MDEDLSTFSGRLDFVLETLGLTNAQFATYFGPNGQQLVNRWRARGRIGRDSHKLIHEKHGMRFPIDWVNEGGKRPPMNLAEMGAAHFGTFDPEIHPSEAARIRLSSSVESAPKSSDHSNWNQGSFATQGPVSAHVTFESQLRRPEPAILLSTYEFLVSAFAISGKAFNLANDSELFADVYEWLASDERPVDKKNLVDFVRWRTNRQMKGKGIDDEQGGSTPGEASGADRSRAAG